MKLHRAATQHSPMAAHPLPGVVARSEREVCEQEGGHSDVSEVGGVDSSRLPGDGACLPGHWSASHGGGRCRRVVDSGILSVGLLGCMITFVIII